MWNLNQSNVDIAWEVLNEKGWRLEGNDWRQYDRFRVDSILNNDMKSSFSGFYIDSRGYRPRTAVHTFRIRGEPEDGEKLADLVAKRLYNLEPFFEAIREKVKVAETIDERLTKRLRGEYENTLQIALQDKPSHVSVCRSKETGQYSIEGGSRTTYQKDHLHVEIPYQTYLLIEQSQSGNY